jgi:hypothetical protein
MMIATMQITRTINIPGIALIIDIPKPICWPIRIKMQEINIALNWLTTNLPLDSLASSAI